MATAIVWLLVDQQRRLCILYFHLAYIVNIVMVTKDLFSMRAINYSECTAVLKMENRVSPPLHSWKEITRLKELLESANF